MKPGRFTKRLMMAGVCCFPLSANAVTIVDVATFLQNFDTADFKAPSIIMNETESTFDLAITGSLVDHELDDDTGTFSEPFLLNFWRGNVTFGQVDGQVNPDSLTASISIFHQAGIDRPHAGDLLRGDIFTFPSTVLMQGNAAVPFGTTVRHRANHSDRYYDGLFSVAGAGGNITGWNFNLKAEHLARPVPEPSTLAVLILGSVGLLLVHAGRRR